MTDTLIRDLEALRVGPDEVLVLRLPGDPGEPEMQRAAEEVTEALEQVGLRDRSLVFIGDVEFAVAPRKPLTEGEA